LISGHRKTRETITMDFEHVKEYGEDLRTNGILDVQVSGLSFWIYHPVRIATARKR
jgi:hypothetical protein